MDSRVRPCPVWISDFCNQVGLFHGRLQPGMGSRFWPYPQQPLGHLDWKGPGLGSVILADGVIGRFARLHVAEAGMTNRLTGCGRVPDHAASKLEGTHTAASMPLCRQSNGECIM